MNNIELIEDKDAIISKLRDELELKSKCLSLIAHDFKGLFSNIIWVLQAYEDKIITEQEFKSMLPEIKQTAQINLNTIGDTFAWVNAQLYEGEIILEEVNVYEVFSELKTSLQKSLIDKNISILQLTDPSFTFKSSSVLLRFILKKLIENAIKYSYLNGEIEVEARRNEGQIHLLVKDKGAGMSEEKLSSIFTMNETNFLGTQGEKGGGLSLVVVNDFVKMMDGKIKIYPNENKIGVVAELIFSSTCHADEESTQFN
jgi:K+-sensing histidine kinase KdpD